MNFDTQEREMEVMLQGGQMLAEGMISVWKKQGHHLTGGWEESLQYTIVGSSVDTTITGTMNLYGIFVDRGVTADRVPYGGGNTGATTSKYIQGLKNYWMLRGLGEREALSAAFATAKKQKSEGMPTAASSAYSETGQRTQFIAITDQEVTPKVNEFISSGVDAIVDEVFHETKSEII